MASDERITLTMAQFDASLKAWKAKGSERTLAFLFIASIPLALVGGFFSTEVSPGAMLAACSAYYLSIAALARFTQ